MENDDKKLMITEEQLSPSATGRLIPAIVVLGALAGFVALAWYAYHSGTQPASEGELPVIEADKTPLKEKPANPGGMQFPNQDKTIYETFSNAPAQPPKVERVLPTPEEPLPPTTDAAPDTTTTWVNDKLKTTTPGKPEQVIGKEEDQGPKAETAKELSPSAAPTEPAAPSAPASAPGTSAASTVLAPLSKENTPEKDQTVTYVAPSKEEAKPEEKPAEKTAEKSAEKAEAPKKAEAPAPEKKPTTSSDAGQFQVQLGAYRSEKEAQDAWDKMEKKHSELADLTPLIVKADLGSKGIYYRLRATGIDSAGDAKALCKTLSAAKQACLVTAGK